MKRWLFLFALAIPVFFIVLIDTHIHSRAYQDKAIQITSLADLPRQMAKIVSIEFPNLLADYIFLNTLTFMGEKVILNQQIPEKDWQKIYSAFEVITRLDPGASDAFTLAQTTLPWEAGMVEETNRLLFRAAKHHPEDYHPYFFLWFNSYYFLEDPQKAGDYLAKAAAVPGSPAYFPALAARMQVYGGRYEVGIAFLKDSLGRTKDPTAIKMLKIRIKALEQMFALEKAAHKYQQKYKTQPAKLQDLVNKGIISDIPEDPYGGEYYILENGRVYTTSGLAFQQSSKVDKKSMPRSK